jgi:hypothetical protein
LENAPWDVTTSPLTMASTEEELVHTRHRFQIAALIAALLFVGACAASPPKHLEQARQVYEQAEQGPASHHALDHLYEARQALMRAERAFANSGDNETTRTLAYIALRRSQEAVAQARHRQHVSQRDLRQEELFAHTEAIRQRQRALLKRLAEALEGRLDEPVGGGPIDQELLDELEQIQRDDANIGEPDQAD